MLRSISSPKSYRCKYRFCFRMREKQMLAEQKKNGGGGAAASAR